MPKRVAKSKDAPSGYRSKAYREYNLKYLALVLSATRKNEAMQPDVLRQWKALRSGIPLPHTPRLHMPVQLKYNWSIRDYKITAPYWAM